MPMQPVLASGALGGFIQNTFVDTYRRKRRDSDARVSLVATLGIASQRSFEDFFFFESPAHPVRWPKGDTISSSSFRGRFLTVENLKYARRIPWFADDAEDDQTQSLESQAMDLASGLALLPERLLFQTIQGIVDPDLLPTIPLAPDGAAVFSTVDGSGADRFGAVGGNLLTGGGVATGAAIRDDFLTAVAQYREFEDTEGQPLFAENDLDSQYVIIYGAANEPKFRDAFIQGTVQGSAAGISNVVLDSGINTMLWSTSRIKTDDWFIVNTGPAIKPFFQTVRKPVTEQLADQSNSDVARDTGINYFQAETRMGWGVGTTYQSIKIDN